ncbi:methyl-accepting chemotaxis protein [Paenibacillus alginolyticus]|uniref:Methyl-accepting chemotaxis protein n=1 Tax=Paenibacillus alginolyticus TaxID=59839 RepID=A0ABT4GLL6_9BACL|nr:HAMP domain-containing methyl-accepting chemotaxis protein [Paenibacillus alginolyticus]MCY9670235.1 methyl-accepting chemotaxis protein [Paenibacillus alginolyticus]MCY9697100.1 methyl-accepting chemotaxis protein [Paenibacillus alginolyticus]MEC0146271.1 HAMP domain-containing methyl-accepting chemotaxis protein [Paenibacillus alginolyticus]
MKKRIPSISVTVGRKLYASFTIILIMMCVLAWFTTSGLKNINQKTKNITGNWMSGVEIINHINYLTEHVLALEFQNMIEADTSTSDFINEEISQTIKKIDQEFELYEKRSNSPEELDLLVKVKTAWSDYISLHTQMVQYATKADIIKGAGKDGPPIIKLIQESQQLFTSMKQDMVKLVKMNHDGAQNASNEADKLYISNVISSIVYVLIAALVAMGLAFLLSIHISKPVRLVSKAMEQAAAGDLSIQVPNIKNRDEIGDLVHSLQTLIRNFGEIVNHIQDASVQVAVSSQQLTAGSAETSLAANQVSVSMQEVAARAEHQMQSSEQTSRAMEDMSHGIQRIAETSGQVSELAVETTRQAEQGNAKIQQAIHKMNALNKSVEQSAVQLNRLNERSTEIGGIVTIIRDIASQTSLLALNASIEAARAGEYGRGFAVVANEVKKLAEQSNQSASQISELIHAIQSDSEQAVSMMTLGINEIHEGSRSIQEAGANFGQIVLSAEHLSEQIQEVAAASEQMHASGEEVSASVTEMAELSRQSFENTQQVASISMDQLTAMEEMSASTTSLSHISVQLLQVTAKFKLK